MGLEGLCICRNAYAEMHMHYSDDMSAGNSGMGWAGWAEWLAGCR